MTVESGRKISILEFLRRQIAGTLSPEDETHMRYPTAISETLGFRVVEIGEGEAAVEVDADPAVHGNQQGTVHGGFLCELADAAAGGGASDAKRPDFDALSGGDMQRGGQGCGGGCEHGDDFARRQGGGALTRV